MTVVHSTVQHELNYMRCRLCQYIHFLGDLVTSIDLYEDQMFSKVDDVRNRSLLNRLPFRKKNTRRRLNTTRCRNVSVDK